MAKRFACRDIGMSCGFEVKAESERELMDAISHHAKSAHGMERIDPQIMSRVKAAIKSV